MKSWAFAMRLRWNRVAFLPRGQELIGLSLEGFEVLSKGVIHGTAPIDSEAFHECSLPASIGSPSATKVT